MLKKDYIDNQKGVTLLELVVAIALLGMLSVSVLMLMSHGITYFGTTERQIELLDNLNSAMNFMSKTVRETQGGYISVASQGELRYRDLDSLGAERLCRFKVDNGVLVRETETSAGSWGNAQGLTSGEITITDLVFTTVSTKTVKIYLQARFKDGKTAALESVAAARTE
ncbi:PulJ/GspJ family protein [Phosphitispora fastidiosa]|uniref:PulJ/GspJ family protein n=1 Tax=Phosphitispora fastidiosa TaxID=2837202 RepID=UPI001E3BA9F2|nr:prepilin-type N-terminal cleavage/methylation domain-containing protein [Phosphitispora fastidiosa]MBU7008769.1 prepilin-type N-terminal cleavage/methylation domain-containing protein [Phosphitispora fastidiosa]